MIKIMVDSASDCSRNDGACQLFVPITITMDGREYSDGVDINSDMFYDMLISGEQFPKTAQPSPQAFADIFEQVRADGDELVYLAVSSQLSGTWQSACIAKDMVGYDGIYIVDTLAATHMIAYLAEHAAQCVAQGATAAETAESVRRLRTRVRAFAGVDTLEYLYRGGRLSRASAAVGGLAGVRPIVTVTQDGRVEAVGKTIGKIKAMQFIAKQLESLGVDSRFPVSSLYTSGEDNCERIEQMLRDSGIEVTGRLQVGPTIGAHLGPGAFGVVFVEKE